MKDDESINRLQDHFNYLDRKVVRALPNGDHRKRGPIVMALPLLDRDLYFVWDVIGITCNAGMGSWIHYHIDDIGWIDDAARAFEAIGYGVIGHNLKECRDRYVAARGDLEGWNDEDLSVAVWDAEDQMEEHLYQHLLSGSFSFQRPSPESMQTEAEQVGTSNGG
jgi:hypothetical protein